MNKYEAPTPPTPGLEHTATTLAMQLAKGNYQNLSVSKMGNSHVIILSPKVLEYLKIEVTSRVMVIPYE